MSKGVVIVVVILVAFAVILGGAYGLAKAGIIPIQKLADKSTTLKQIATAIGLKSTPHATSVSNSADTVVREKQRLAQAAAADEAALREKQKLEQQLADEAAKQAARDAMPDPRSISRLAGVYGSMQPETVTKIFNKLPDDHVIALLRKMDERQVGAILAAVPPDRAARLTLELARKAPAPVPDQTAVATP